jgi:ADP-heptose:LPS heptosyltransferase
VGDVVHAIPVLNKLRRRYPSARIDWLLTLDVTETLELVPPHWQLIQQVREKFSCRSCEAITQPPAPSPA